MINLTSFAASIATMAISWLITKFLNVFLWDDKYKDGSAKSPWSQNPAGLPWIWKGYVGFKSESYRAFTRWGKELGDVPLYSVRLVQKRVVVLNHAGVVRTALVDNEQLNSSRTPSGLVDGVQFIMGDQGKTVFTAAFSLYWGRIRRAISKVIGKLSADQFDHVFKRQAALFSKGLGEKTAIFEAAALREKVDLLAMEATLTMVLGKQEFPVEALQTLITVCHDTQALQESKWYHHYAPFLPLTRVAGLLSGGNTPIIALRNRGFDTLLALKQQDNSIAKSLQVIEPSKNDPEPVQLSSDEIYINMLHLTMHGYQYLSSALFTVIQRLATLPDYQERLFQSNDSRELADAIVTESLRFNPPARIYSHTSRDDHAIELDGNKHRVDDETELIVNLDTIHFDEQFYAKPNNFNPDRFFSVKKNSILDLKGKANDHLAFGVGRRACQGSRASQRVLATTITDLVRRYKLEGGDVEESVDCASNVWNWTGRTETKGAAIKFTPRE